MPAYALPPDLALALKIGLIVGLILIGLGVFLLVSNGRNYGTTPISLAAWGSVVMILSSAPWLDVRSDVALGVAIGFVVALIIGVVKFTRQWDRAHIDHH